MSRESERFPSTPERMKYEPLAGLSRELKRAGANINLPDLTEAKEIAQLVPEILEPLEAAGENINNALLSLEKASELLSEKLEPLKKEVIKQVLIEPKEREAISLTLEQPSDLLGFFTEKGLDANSTVKEYLIRVLQIRAFEGEYYSEITGLSVDALELSDQLREALEETGTIPPRIKLNDQVEILKGKLKELMPDEFDEFDEEDEEKKLKTELGLIDAELWKEGLDEKQRELILNIWQNLDEDDEDSIMSDDHTGNGTELILARHLGVTPNQETRTLASTLRKAVTNLSVGQ